MAAHIRFLLLLLLLLLFLLFPLLLLPLLLLISVYLSGLFVARQVESRNPTENSKRCSRIAGPPLSGESALKHTSLPGVYDPKNARVTWDLQGGVYWWSIPFRSSHRASPFHGGSNKRPTAEVGKGWWLTTVEYKFTGRDWSSRSFIADRATMFNHTSCCCQYMQSDLSNEEYGITTWCRAVVPGLEKSPADSCAPFSAACPPDNGTASLQDWPMPPYTEKWSACMQPIGHTLERPYIRPAGSDLSAPKWAIQTNAAGGSEFPGEAFLFAMTGMFVVSSILVWRGRTFAMRTSGPRQIEAESLQYIQLM